MGWGVKIFQKMRGVIYERSICCLNKIEDENDNEVVRERMLENSKLNRACISQGCQLKKIYLAWSCIKRGQYVKNTLEFTLILYVLLRLIQLPIL